MNFQYGTTISPNQAKWQTIGDQSYVDFDGGDANDDDDVLYAELRRQILLLTADDSDDFAGIRCEKSLHKQVAKKFPTKLQPESYFNWWEGPQNSDSVPTWLVNLWRKGSGTGVFIPQIVKSTTRYSNGRTYGKRRVYRQLRKN